jgi:hypothetical protein
MCCKKKQKVFMPSQEQKRLILHDAVYYEILFAFGISAHDETDYCSWEHINFSRMGHARALYWFFETSIADRKQDDVVSEDFKFGPIIIQRPSDDQTRLNKDLFHLTYARLRHFANLQNKPWPNSILSCLHEPCVEFIKHLLAHKNEFGASNDFVMWEQLLTALNSGREFRIHRTFTQAGVESHYTFTFGSSLQFGRSELTKPKVIL